MKKVGQILELDPEKKYVMLVEADAMSVNDVKYMVDVLTAQKDNLTAISLPCKFESIQFVENSDRVVDVVKK